MFAAAARRATRAVSASRLVLAPGRVDIGRPALTTINVFATADAQAANLIALLLTAIGNTAANRRFTFGVGGRTNAARHHVEGLIVFAIALTITSGSLGVLHTVVDQPHQLLELGVLVLANLVATAVRFVLLRGWVFHPRRSR